ncbi:MAG: hypothetical protein AAGJ50_06860 [Pseudomonadota bacterium]
MLRKLPALVFLAVHLGAAPASVAANELDELLGAAVRLKQAHVMRSYEECRSVGSSDAVCREELTALHPREISALNRLARHIESVSETELSAAFTRCYDPAHNYLDLIECWERLADRLEQGQEIDVDEDQKFRWENLSTAFAPLSSIKRRTLVLCIRGTIKRNFEDTVAHNLGAGGSDTTWALKVSAIESQMMIEVAQAASWAGLRTYYDHEAKSLEALIQGTIGLEEYRGLAKQNEQRLTTALAPEAANMAMHSRNFVELEALCADVAAVLIGRAKAIASQ